MTDRIGRKKTLLITGIPNAAGWILIAISPYVTAAGPSVFKVIILTGRFLIGVACSGIFAAVPVSEGSGICIRQLCSVQKPISQPLWYVYMWIVLCDMSVCWLSVSLHVHVLAN